MKSRLEKNDITMLIHPTKNIQWWQKNKNESKRRKKIYINKYRIEEKSMILIWNIGYKE